MTKIDTKNRIFIPLWDGNREEAEPVKIELARLSLEDYWKVATICTSIGTMAKAEGDFLARFASAGDIIKEITPLLKRYIVSMQNLTVDDNPAKPEDLTKTSLFLSLVMEILAELLSISTLDASIKKKLEALSPDVKLTGT